jgi:hypothetical protein
MSRATGIVLATVGVSALLVLAILVSMVLPG